MENKVLVITPEELTAIENNVLNPTQMQHLLKKTPEKYIKKRPAKGGGQWEYVSIGYVQKVLNMMFAWDWDFEILEQSVMSGEVVVKGRLTCRTNGRTIAKTQFGNKEIMYKKQSDEERANGTERIPLSIGNDMKAAASDALKKCASQIGIASDIYNKEEFKEVQIDTRTIGKEDLKKLFELKRDVLKSEDISRIEEVLATEEKKSYLKIFNQLSKL